jgi:primase-polymerase (primpol)-like protein
MNARKPFIPPALKAMPQWMLWKLILKEGQDKPAKVPFSPKTRMACNPVDASNYMPYGEAVQQWKVSPSAYKGLAFGLVQGVVCVDLDDCLDGDGNVKAWAKGILDQLPASFVEVSQSGKGLHWFGLASLPEGARQRFTLPCGNRVEIYERKRFIAMTGKAMPNSLEDVTEAQDAISSLYKRLTIPPEDPAPQPHNVGLEHIQGVMARMYQSKHGHEIQALWNGDIARYGGDDSSADMALLTHLAFWTNKDVWEMERLFSQSALGQRDKWQKRADYRKRSIQKALENVQAGYNSYDPLRSGMEHHVEVIENEA